MSPENAITAFHGSKVPSTEELNTHLLAGRESKAPVPGGSTPFLRLDPDGNWIYGAENVEVEEGSLWTINPMTLTVGWVCWADAKLNGGKRGKLGEVMGPCSQPPAMPMADHSDKGGEWKNQYGFDLKCISGEDEGQEVAFRTSSMGGSKAYNAVYDELMARPDPDFFFPIVELKHTSYKNSNYGGRVVVEPEFKIRDWCDKDRLLLSKADAVANDNNVISIDEAPETDGRETETVSEAGSKRRKRRIAS